MNDPRDKASEICGKHGTGLIPAPVCKKEPGHGGAHHDPDADVYFLRTVEDDEA